MASSASWSFNGVVQHQFMAAGIVSPAWPIAVFSGENCVKTQRFPQMKPLRKSPGGGAGAWFAINSSG
jgi:hypothetical protein